jgi:hypothetical protein
MGTELPPKGQDPGSAPDQAAATGPVPAHVTSAGLVPTTGQQGMLRHLERLRDGAQVILSLFASFRGAPGAEVVAPTDQAVEPPAREPRRQISPLEARIERHMGIVERAVERINELKAGETTGKEPPEEVRQAIAKNERTIREIVEAEVLFWAEAIENSPLTGLSETQRAWVRRVIRLAGSVTISDDRQEQLKFLRGYVLASQH